MFVSLSIHSPTPVPCAPISLNVTPSPPFHYLSSNTHQTLLDSLLTRKAAGRGVYGCVFDKLEFVFLFAFVFVRDLFYSQYLTISVRTGKVDDGRGVLYRYLPDRLELFLLSVCFRVCARFVSFSAPECFKALGLC